MGDLTTFNLQGFVDGYNCQYYTETGATEDTIEYAVRFPFIRIYSLNQTPDSVTYLRERFWFNNRIQVFERTHETAFYELVRIIPTEYSAVVYLSDLSLYKDIEQLAKARPAKRDILIIDNKICTKLPDLAHINRFFGLTHYIFNGSFGVDGKGLVLVPYER